MKVEVNILYRVGVKADVSEKLKNCGTVTLTKEPTTLPEDRI